MELAEDVAHGTCRFLELGGRVEPELRHRVDDAPLHRFQAVADVRQGPVENDVCRIGPAITCDSLEQLGPSMHNRFHRRCGGLQSVMLADAAART